MALSSRLLTFPVGGGATRLAVDVSSDQQVAFAHAALHEQAAAPPLQSSERVVLDLGANDGFQGSHSYTFITALGYNGCLIEPDQENLK